MRLRMVEKSVMAALGVLALVGCGGPKMTVDAGVDTSCGIDCAAQGYYGLIANRCFEYSDSTSSASNPPKLGILVKPVFDLEGGLTSIPVEYRQNGQTLQTDYFTIKSGQLWLLRRITTTGGSVTWKTGADITGVQLLGGDSEIGTNVTTTADAFLSRDDSTTPVTFRVGFDAPTASEARTPLGTFDGGVKLLIRETPDHGADTRRVFEKNLGFVLVASPFNTAGGTNPVAYSLQRVRDIGTPDAGPEQCDQGTP